MDVMTKTYEHHLCLKEERGVKEEVLSIEYLFLHN